ncbi:MAG: hypothetical protein QXL23_02400, partial [Candidatus Nitrosocaldus sp.]
MIEYLAYVMFVTVSWIMSIYGFNFYYLFFRSIKNGNGQGKGLALNKNGNGNGSISTSSYNGNNNNGDCNVRLSNTGYEQAIDPPPYVTVQLPI